MQEFPHACPFEHTLQHSERGRQAGSANAWVLWVAARARSATRRARRRGTGASFRPGGARIKPRCGTPSARLGWRSRRDSARLFCAHGEASRWTGSGSGPSSCRSSCGSSTLPRSAAASASRSRCLRRPTTSLVPSSTTCARIRSSRRCSRRTSRGCTGCSSYDPGGARDSVLMVRPEA
jgi:hypothetical protein